MNRGERILAGAMEGFIFILNLMDKGFLKLVIVTGRKKILRRTVEMGWARKVPGRMKFYRRGWGG